MPDVGLARKLKHFRKAAGLTQQAVADALGVHKQTYVRYEAEGDSAIDIPTSRLPDIARILGTTSSELTQMDFDERGGAPAVESDTFSPNPRYAAELPPRAYAVARGYLDRLVAVGLGRDELEEAERLIMLDSKYGQLNRRTRGEMSEDDAILLIEAGWDIVSTTLSWKGVRP